MRLLLLLILFIAFWPIIFNMLFQPNTVNRWWNCHNRIEYSSYPMVSPNNRIKRKRKLAWKTLWIYQNVINRMRSINVMRWMLNTLSISTLKVEVNKYLMSQIHLKMISIIFIAIIERKKTLSQQCLDHSDVWITAKVSIFFYSFAFFHFTYNFFAIFALILSNASIIYIAYLFV